MQIWRPPQQGWIKINFDASIKEGRGTSFGAVWQNHEGNVMAAATSFQPQCYQPKIAESMAFRP